MEPTGDVLAAIAFTAGTVFLTTDRPSVLFGRAAECPVRFAHQPVADASVPRVAGRIAAADGRLLVENLSDRVAFDLKTPDGPLETVRPGALLSPAAPSFEVVYRSATDVHVVLVQGEATPRPLPPPVVPRDCDQPPTRVVPELTDRQWQVLDAYTEPLRHGRTAPATHKQVASRLNWGYNTIRIECNAIWAAFRVAGVSMREFRDKRDAVIDAAIRHRLRPSGQQADEVH
jgi:hypothetical protein